MGTLLSYSILSGIVLLTLCLAFLLTLSSRNQHAYNRAIALTIYAVAFLIFPIKSLFSSSGVGSGNLPLAQIAAPLPAVADVNAENPALWPTALLWLYLAGMAVVAALTLRSWHKILSIIRSGEKIKKDGYTLVLTDRPGLSPFSWMRFVVMTRRDYADCADPILIHERRHIALRHWIDLLIAQAAVILNWFNPAAWLMRNELMLIHEYQADQAVLQSGCNPQQYQMMLIRKAAGARIPGLANSLNNNKLKKRITMMYKKKASKKQRLNAFVLLPAAALALALTVTPQVSATISKIQNSGLSAEKAVAQEAKGDTLEFAQPTVLSDGEVLTDIENMEKIPEYQGGFEALAQFLVENVKYPKAAQQAGKKGNVLVQFAVRKDGRVTDAEVIKGIDPALDAEALRAVNATSGKWIPGQQKGKPVNCLFVIPVGFGVQ